MNHKYIGNSICCGSYSVIHLLEEEIDVDLFELTTGVPFGIKGSIEERRILTTYVDPNKGLETGLQIWGISSKKYSYKDKEQAWEEMQKILEREGKLILGPVDMLKLYYIPLSTLYAGMDHYIYIKRQDFNHITVKDSEGYLNVKLEKDVLKRIWDIRNVIEARGKYVFRVIDKKYDQRKNRKELLQKAYILMCKNVCEAEFQYYGSYVFERIIKYVGISGNNNWHNGMLYDLTHLLQRKVITREMLSEIVGDISCERELHCVSRQIEILPYLYREVEEGKMPSKVALRDVGKLEKELFGLCYKKLDVSAVL